MKELLLSFQDNSPKYKQIYHFIRELIENGELRANTHLPSIRQLADLLHVSRNTTLVAYEQLLAEGFIRSDSRRGYYVEDFENTDIHVSRSQQQTEQIREATRDRAPFIDFRIGGVDAEAFPLKAWRRCTNKVLQEASTYVYGDRQGDPYLREQIAGYLLQSRGIRTHADSIVIGSSMQHLLLHLSILLKSEGFSSLAVENPGYDGARTVFGLQGFQLEPIGVSPKGLIIEQLEHTKARLAYITPSHHFPTGVTMPMYKRHQLLKWASDRSGYIIEDDYDSEFRYKQKPIPALSSLQQNDSVIYVSTFSKSFLPSIRLSYMILPPKLLDKYKMLFAAMEQAASGIHQRTMAYFMEGGFWDSHVRKMRALYKRKMNTLVTAFSEVFGDTVQVIGADSGLYVLIRPQLHKKESELIKQALSCGVKVYPTSHYYMNNPPNGPQLQVGISNITEENIRTGAKLLQKAWISS
ncbi:PLP-dependent aminotransferase family protein [Paenibacillus puldeungensis]|uniref:PLP-dependent aminotransferase family protein n=1 Tax=Paenibacillus puldeungensis TaxID=696536 RepID=A0ABW3S1C2_9BACL